MVDWNALRLALVEALLVMVMSAPVAWFFHGWAMAVVDAVSTEDN